MRIGVDVRELARGRRTGIGRYVEAFVREAPSQRSDAHLYLYADHSTRADLPRERAERRTLPAASTLWFDQVALPRALTRDRVDVFLSPYYKAPLVAPCPTVITIHDVLFLRVGGPRWHNALFKPWARLLASRTAAILTDSECSRRDLEILLGLDGRSIEVIPLGVDPSFSPLAASRSPELKGRLRLPEDYVLAVTNFLPHKNDLLLVRAFARLAVKHEGLGLVLAGGDPQGRETLGRLVQEHGLEGRVHLPGAISEADLPALYAGARLFAFPSLYEGFGLPVLEAMACGVPVVCSSRGSLPEVAGDAALLCNPEDEEVWQHAMERSLSDATLRKGLVASGLERARQFDWPSCTRRVLSVLERVTVS